jgi:hypothetical protein
MVAPFFGFTSVYRYLPGMRLPVSLTRVNLTLCRGRILAATERACMSGASNKRSAQMKNMDLLAYQDMMAGVTKDVHDTCAGMEISVMWDDGKARIITGSHKVKLWNNLGAVEFHIDHDDLLAKGNSYKGFLVLVETRAKKELSV